MKTLYESLLSDIDTTLDSGADKIKEEIQSFLEHNYYGISRYCEISDDVNKDGLYEVKIHSTFRNGEVKLMPSAKSFTNGTFVITEANCSLEISNNYHLTTLEDCPKNIKKTLCIAICPNLVSLKGCPEKVEMFVCRQNNKLKSLKGCPKIVEKDFICVECDNIKSLSGFPKQVDNVYILFCGKKFTEDEIQKVCNVKNNIRV